MKSTRRQFTKPIKIALLCLNIFIAVVYMLSAYAGYINPNTWIHPAFLGLAYPILLPVVVLFLLVWIFTDCRFLLVSGIVLAATIGQIWSFCPLNFGGASGQDADFRVMTYNTFGMRSPDTSPTVVDEILEYDADFVCIQESAPVPVIRNRFKGHGWEKIEQRYPHFDVSAATNLGYLSKKPVETIAEDYDDQYFCYAIYRTTIGKRQAYFFSIHLESIGLSNSDKQLYMELTAPDDRNRSLRGVRSQLLSKLGRAFRARAKQAELIREKIDSIRDRQPDAAIFVCGDFNDTPQSYAYQTIKGDMNDAYIDGALGPTYTYNANRFYFRIDHILYEGNSIEATSAARGSSKASDHYPVIADFEIGK